MPRRTENAASNKSVELAKQEDHLEFDDPDEADEEEEVEYEEIEEEVEYEEVEEEEEDEETEVAREVDAKHDSKMVDVDEEDEETEVAREVDAKHDNKLVDVDEKDECEKKKHAELLALPPHGCEVYVGGISSGVSSDDVKKLFESVGEVVEVRMRIKGDNRMYAFVNFRTEELAKKAIQKLNNKDLKGKKIIVSSAQAKNTLFIGNVPNDWTQDDLKNTVEEVGPGVLDVKLIMAPRSDRNKGYGFVEYYNQSCAEYAKEKMSTPEFKLDDNVPTVSWADAKNSGESASKSASKSASTPQVKSLYVKNLPKTVTQEQLKRLFEHLGEITKVVLPPAKPGHKNRYGFVHFKQQSMVMKALKNTERYELDGQLLECSLAKPPADKKDDTLSVPTTKGPSLPRYAPLGYGLMGANPLGNGLAGAYNPLGNGLAGTYNPLGNGLAGAYGMLSSRATQPMLYAPGAPPGSTMVTMVLPDGRLVYVPQPARQQLVPVASPPPQQGGRRYGGGGGADRGSASGGSSSGGRRQRGDDRGSTSNNSRRGRHRPY